MAQKVTLRYQYILSQTGNAQGDFKRTQEGAANQMRIFTEGLKELGVEFGQVLLPAFTKIVKFANNLIKKFKGLSDNTKKVIVVVALLVAAIGPVLIAIGSSADPCLFIKGDLRVMLFVDDCLTTYPNTCDGETQYKCFVSLLQREYKLQDDGMTDATAYLGMHAH